MLQIFLSLAQRASDLTTPQMEAGEAARRISDPMSDPVLKAMRPSELADIPFPRPQARLRRRDGAEA